MSLTITLDLPTWSNSLVLEFLPSIGQHHPDGLCPAPSIVVGQLYLGHFLLELVSGVVCRGESLVSTDSRPVWGLFLLTASRLSQCIVYIMNIQQLL